jgi:FAD/FMN-containing dehydrogenase/ferredoxin
MKPGAPPERGLAVSAGPGSLPSLAFDVPYPNGLAPLSRMLAGGLPLGERPASERSRRLALSLAAHLAAAGGLDDEAAAGPDGAVAAPRAARLVVDPALLAESDRDQNVYLGRIFTRYLTKAVPDLVFLPDETMEVVEALRWARATATPVTVRGAASAALGGAVANEGGLVLDLAHLDKADIDPTGEVCVVGAGARLRRVHRVLARRGLALPVYPSNLGATLAGWFATGGAGLNAFGPGQVLDIVRAADVVLPSGELVRFHADGRLDVAAPSSGHGHREVAPDQAEAWFAERGLAPFGLADLAGSEGVLGVVTQLVVSVGRRPEIGAFLLGFADEAAALRAAAFVAANAGTSLPRPANLVMVSAAHRRHAALAAADDARQRWRRFPAALSTDSDMPWSSIRGPRDFGWTYVPSGEQPRLEPAALLYVDFLEEGAARRFAARLAKLPGEPIVMADESVAFAAARFRPQRNKRLGPGLLAAEIDLPAGEIAAFLAGAERLALGAGVALEHEVYFLAGERALVIAGYLTDHRSSSFLLDLALTPVLLDLAVRRHGGRPYVLGRWQSSFAADKFGAAGLARLGAIKGALDPGRLLGRGVLFGLALRGPLGWVVERAYRRGVGLMSLVWRTPGLAVAARLMRAALRLVPGPGHGRGEPVGRGTGGPALYDTGDLVRHGRGEPGRRDLPVLARSLHCVNCGECNAVCPVYDELALRLPQALVHHGETTCKRRRLPAGAGVLLDLCLRCGGCEQVCQAGIAHLEVYAALEELRPVKPARESAKPNSDDQASRAAREAALAALRRSPRYRRAFLEIRPGEYLRRTPASLPGRVSFLVLRAENDAGAAATCRHCAACVAVCPSGANREFEDADVRLISTDQASCVGCGTCVEVCPANRDNGGQTLRVVEAPAADWLAALSELAALRGSDA